MIARIWEGAVPADQASAYIDYIRKTGIADYRATPGNLGAWMFHRIAGDLCEVQTLSFWTDVEAIKGFAGEDYEKARYYPPMDDILVRRPETVEHYEVAES